MACTQHDSMQQTKYQQTYAPVICAIRFGVMARCDGIRFALAHDGALLLLESVESLDCGSVSPLCREGRDHDA